MPADEDEDETDQQVMPDKTTKMSGVLNPFALLGGDESEDDSEDERIAGDL